MDLIPFGETRKMATSGLTAGEVADAVRRGEDETAAASLYYWQASHDEGDASQTQRTWFQPHYNYVEPPFDFREYPSTVVRPLVPRRST